MPLEPSRNYRLEAKGVAWWEEIPNEVVFDGKRRHVPQIRLRPDELNDVRVERVDDHTARIDYDNDLR